MRTAARREATTTSAAMNGHVRAQAAGRRTRLQQRAVARFQFQAGVIEMDPGEPDGPQARLQVAVRGGPRAPWESTGGASIWKTWRSRTSARP